MQPRPTVFNTPFHDASLFSIQLKVLAGNFVTNFESANGHLLQVRPRQPANDRRLVEVLVHFLVVMRCLPPNPLRQPLAALAFNPASMMVRIVSNMQF